MDSTQGHKNFAQMALELQELATRIPENPTLTVYGILTMDYDVERKMNELVSMLRLNGGQVLFRREVLENKVVWKNLRVYGFAVATAWFFEEVAAIPGWTTTPVSVL